MAIKDCGLEGDGREVTLDGLELLYCQLRPDSTLCVKVERGLKRKRASRKIEVLMEKWKRQITWDKTCNDELKGETVVVLHFLEVSLRTMAALQGM